MQELDEIKQALRSFAGARNWDQFHTPKNLVMALSGEVGELNEIYQWLTADESKKDNISVANLAKTKEEVADILLYLIRLADTLDIDLKQAAIAKLKQNEEKYPVALSKDNAIKYNRREE